MESVINDHNFGLYVSQLKISFESALVGASQSFECVSKKYENHVSAQNHQKLIQLEKGLLNKEVNLVVSVKKSIERVKRAEQELLCSQTDLLRQYIHSIKGLECLVDNEREGT